MRLSDVNLNADESILDELRKLDDLEKEVAKEPDVVESLNVEDNL